MIAAALGALLSFLARHFPTAFQRPSRQASNGLPTPCPHGPPYPLGVLEHPLRLETSGGQHWKRPGEEGIQLLRRACVLTSKLAPARRSLSGVGLGD